MEEFEGLEISMGKRSAAQAADDLEAIAAAVRALDITRLPARLSMGPRGCDIDLRTVKSEN